MGLRIQREICTDSRECWIRVCAFSNSIYGGIRSCTHPASPTSQRGLIRGQENQHESVSFSQALLHNTKKLNVIAALLPGPWNPAVAAKQIASIDHYSNGRISVNVVSGWFKAEFTSIGQWWLEHAERYRYGHSKLQTYSVQLLTDF